MIELPADLSARMSASPTPHVVLGEALTKALFALRNLRDAFDVVVILLKQEWQAGFRGPAGDGFDLHDYVKALFGLGRDLRSVPSGRQGARLFLPLQRRLASRNRALHQGRRRAMGTGRCRSGHGLHRDRLCAAFGLQFRFAVCDLLQPGIRCRRLSGSNLLRTKPTTSGCSAGTRSCDASRC